MSVLVFAESQAGTFKKSTFETVSYAAQTAAAMGVDCIALVLGTADNAGELGRYGAARVWQVADVNLNKLDSQSHTAVIAEAVQKAGAKLLVLSHTSTGKSLIGRLAVRLNAGSVSGVNALPTTDGGGFQVNKPVFSGKATATFEVSSEVKIVSLIGNSVPIKESGAAVSVEDPGISPPAAKVRVKSVNRVEGTVPLPEAEIVVSAGRGMKGPENWGMIEELAELLGATTACSRPVADTGWRPHHEHVGQTGIAIRPNLYFAIGISGAIQHLAGVNSSKVIVVINKDPEAPFFKAANYGVQADLFDVVPRLIEAVKKFKASA